MTHGDWRRPYPLCRAHFPEEYEPYRRRIGYVTPWSNAFPVRYILVRHKNHIFTTFLFYTSYKSALFIINLWRNALIVY